MNPDKLYIFFYLKYLVFFVHDELPFVGQRNL